MKNAVILALDMGTSSVRAMLFDARAKDLPGMEAQLAYAQRTTADGGVETDAETLLRRTLECLVQLLKKTDAVTKAHLAGVGISCFWHSLVGVGSDDRAVTPVYSWADTRSKGQIALLKSRLDPDAYHRRTGAVLHPSFWPAKLLWLHETAPDMCVRVARWMSFGEYLLLRLFGTAGCTVSMASATGLFDQNKGDWDLDTLAVLPLEATQLNPLIDRDEASHGLLPEFARLLSALKEIPWFPAVGDGVCSNVGSAATDQSRIAINVGTSGAMRILMEAPSVQIVPGLFCYRLDRKRFILGGAFANGGNVYAWEHDALQLGPRPVAARRLGTMPADSHGLTVLPFWAGERSPGWHADAQATITGMNLHTTSLDILRASLESVAYCFDTVRELLQNHFSGEQEIVASGGALVHDPVWVQIMADVFGCPIRTSRVFEASSRGAAILALESLGLLKTLDQAPAYLGTRYQPDLRNHAIYTKARTRFDALYTLMLDKDRV